MTPDLPDSKVSAARVALQRNTRYNPLRQLDPETLGRQLDGFAAGTLREFAILADAVARRDDTLAAVIAKRVGAPARHPYEIMIGDDVPEDQKAEAEKHAEALRYFYANLRVRDAVRRDLTGGFKLLVRQMLTGALSLGCCVHETLWSPGPDGLTATLQHVPLWFFENRTGSLRFLPSDSSWDGEPLEPGAWFITCAPTALMEPSTVAYLYKRMALGDWVNFNERFGFPIMDATTPDPVDSPGWTSLAEALAGLGREASIVRSQGTTLQPIEVKGTGEAPFNPLIERMDRAMSRIWRGADLSTVSSGQGTGRGASLQGDESGILEDDDIALVNEALNDGLDRRVIEWTFGEGVAPLAYIRIVKPDVADHATDVIVDTFLRDSGAPLAVAATMERYGRPMPQDGEPVLTKPAAPTFGPPATSNLQPATLPALAAANESTATPDPVAQAITDAGRSDRAFVLQRLMAIRDIADPELRKAKLTAFRDSLPQLAADLTADPAAAEEYRALLGAALAQGLTQAPAAA